MDENTLTTRIFCAIWGHKWLGAGWLGGLIMSDDFVHRYKCDRCNIYINIIEPNWHLRARFNNKIKNEDKAIKLPNRFRIDDPDYVDQLKQINKTYPTKVLAKIHNTTTKKLRKIGYC